MTAPIQKILDSVDFKRTVSTGCDYYDHLTVEVLCFTTDGVDVWGEYESIEWLITEAYKEA